VLRITSKVVFASEASPLHDQTHFYRRRMSAKNYKQSRLCVRGINRTIPGISKEG
jgi:hypothetical protein